MKRDGSIVSVIAVCLLGLTIVLYAGLKKRPRIVETKAIADVIETSAESAAEPLEGPLESYPQINTVLVDQQRLVMGTSNGIYIKPDLGEGLPEKRDAGIGITYLNAILPMGDHRYVGGEGLYLLDENYTLYLDQYDFCRRVRALMEFGEGILVGSETGLWYHCDMPVDENMPQDTLLKEGIIVTALAEDRGGLWVGTYGDGLYRFDGQKWQRRYLHRDTSMFDYVTALEYFYPNLWVGTGEGIFRYDGGKWAQMFVADSSEYHNVTAIMTTPAATYIGTDCGLLRYTADGLVEERDYEGMEIVGFCRSEKGVIVATRNDGIFTYMGKEELVSPEQLIPDYFAGDEIENIAETDPEAFTVPYETGYAGDTDY